MQEICRANRCRSGGTGGAGVVGGPLPLFSVQQMTAFLKSTFGGCDYGQSQKDRDGEDDGDSVMSSDPSEDAPL